jgi:ferredoxin-NADP reductase
MVSHGRPGFYLRVLQEGTVQAGDDIVRIGAGPEAVSVSAVDALLYRPGHPRADLERALRIPALSPGWKGSLQALLDAPTAGGAGNVGLTAAAAAPPPAWSGFRRLRVRRVRQESESVFSLTLTAPDGDPLPPAEAGQFVTVRLPEGSQGAALVRSYSLSGAPGAPEYRISVKQEPHGAASRWLHEHAIVGTELEVAAPRGVFTLAQDRAPVLLVSAGVGVTPVLAMLHQLAAARSPRPVWWLHGARNGAELPFAAEVRQLLAQLPEARSRICFSRPLPSDRRGIDYTDQGHLGAELIASLGVPRDADAYICGPQPFMRDMVLALTGSGLDAARVRTETFGTLAAVTPGVVAGAGAARPPHPPDHPAEGQQAATVSFARSGLTVPWHADGPSLLELAEACDVPVRWSCRTGVCHTCETALVSGVVAYAPEPVEAPAAGDVLLCCARPQGDVVLDA